MAISWRWWRRDEEITPRLPDGFNQRGLGMDLVVQVRIILVPQLKKTPSQQGVAAALLFFTSANL
jgi:hypothetical protein